MSRMDYRAEVERDEPTGTYRVALVEIEPDLTVLRGPWRATPETAHMAVRAVLERLLDAVRVTPEPARRRA